MATFDRFRSTQEVERLAELKRGVDLVALATERYGYTITEKSRDGGFTLRNTPDGGGDRITVKMAAEGYHKYYNHNNDRDNGTVVDFLQQRHPGRNLGQVKGMLQDMVPGARAALDLEAYKSQGVKLEQSADNAYYNAMPAQERRAARVKETMGTNTLTDTSYLATRGLSKETTADPAFAGRIFTDQHPDRLARHNVGFPFSNEQGVQSFELRNHPAPGKTGSWKHAMPHPLDKDEAGRELGAKNGVWSSNLTAGSAVPADRLVIGESAIDMISKYQVEREAATTAGRDLPNARYVATGGTPAEDQRLIIQGIIDTDKPRNVVLANDNDPAGQAFNARYLNDLRSPVDQLSPEQRQEAAQARQSLQWLATFNGKKGDEAGVSFTVTFRHETARDGRAAVENLRTQAELRGLPIEQSGGTGTTGLEVVRNKTDVTEVVLRVPAKDMEPMLELAQELRRERERTLPEVARTPESYFVVEKATSKDYNQDVMQARADAQLDAARREAGFTTEAGVSAAAALTPPLTTPLTSPVMEPANDPALIPRPEPALERAQIRIIENEPLPEGVRAPSELAPRSLSEEIRQDLERSGLEVTSSPVPGTEGPQPRTYLEFAYESDSNKAVAAAAIIGDAMHEAAGRISAVGIVPVETGYERPLGAGELPSSYASVALVAEQDADVLRARLTGAGLAVAGTEVDGQPGLLVLLRPEYAREAAVLERVLDLHQAETGQPVTVLQSELTASERVRDVNTYYGEATGADRLPPKITGRLEIEDNGYNGRAGDGLLDRLERVGATVNPREEEPQGPMGVDGSRAIFVVEYPLDQPAVAANVDRLLQEGLREKDYTLEAENSFVQTGREALRKREGDAGVDLELVGHRPETVADIRAERNTAEAGPTAEALIPGQQLTRAEMSALRTVGATVELNEAADSVRYPLDKPEVVARVSALLDNFENRNNEYGIPQRIDEGPGVRENRQQVGQEIAFRQPGLDLPTRMEVLMETGVEPTGTQLVLTGAAATQDMEKRVRETGAEANLLWLPSGQQERLVVYSPLDQPEVATRLAQAVAQQAAEFPEAAGAAYFRHVDKLGEPAEPLSVREAAALRSFGATVGQVPGADSVRYPLNEPEVTASVSALLDNYEKRNADRPGFQQLTEEPAMRETRQQVAQQLATQQPGLDLPTRVEMMLLPESNGLPIGDQLVLTGAAANRELQERIQRTGAEATLLLLPDGQADRLVVYTPTLMPEMGVRVAQLVEQQAAEQQAAGQPAVGPAEATRTPFVPVITEFGELQDRLMGDTRFDHTKLGYPGVATAAVGYPGTEEYFKERLVEAGATLIERPVTELAPAGTQSISYPLDAPETVARVSLVLDEIDSAARARTANIGAEAGPVGVYESVQLRETRQQAAVDYAPEQTTSATRVDQGAQPEPSLNELRAAVVEERQQLAGQPAATPQISADIDNNGSTSAEEILRADRNRDGIVTGSELDAARFEARQGQQTPEERQAEIRADYALLVAAAEAERQRQEPVVSERNASTAQQSAAIVVYEAEGLPAGTLAPGSTTLLTLAEKLKETIEATGSEVSINAGRDATTQQPYSMLSFAYHENSPEHGQIQQALRDAQSLGVTKFYGIEPGVETQRETEPLTRTVALNEQPLAIALDAPNPLLESQLRATGATVSNEPVQDRPGLVVVVDTNRGEQLAGVEQTLARLPATALVVEGPEATETRQQMTLNFREQGGAIPVLMAEASLPDRIQHDVPERLREAGATVVSLPYATRPELGEGTLSVRYPLNEPEVMGRVSVVLDQVNERSKQLAAELGVAPNAGTGSVGETSLAQQTRQQVAREQGIETTPARELSERQPTEDRPIARPKSVEILDTPQQGPAAERAETKTERSEGRPEAVAPEKNTPEKAVESGIAERHAIERRVVIEISNDKASSVDELKQRMSQAGFGLTVTPIEAAGEELGRTRIEAVYRTTDSLADRRQQDATLQTARKIDAAGLSVREPEGQAQERAQALQGPGQPQANQMLAPGSTQGLRAYVTVLEVDGGADRTTRLWTDLRNAGAQVGHVAKTELGAEGTKFAFPVEYRPSDTRLSTVSALLDAAGRGEGIQVAESDNMRLERLARTFARESKQLAEMSPEARTAHVRPPEKEYPVSRPDAYERVAVSSETLRSAAAVIELRDALKETGAVVAVQQPDGHAANSGTVLLSFAAETPRTAAVMQVLDQAAEAGATVYNLKSGQDLGTREKELGAAEQSARPLSEPATAAQDQNANLADLRSLESRREALLEHQREATAQSQLAAQYLLPTPVAGEVQVPVEALAVKPWVGFGHDLRGEYLVNVDAKDMDLREANLAGQDLRSTDLRGTDLRGANLSDADLRGANLTGVRLEGALMDGARLDKAFLVVENSEGKREINDKLTVAELTGPERGPDGPRATLSEQPLAPAALVAATQQAETVILSEDPGRLQPVTATVVEAVAAPVIAPGVELPAVEAVATPVVAPIIAPVVELPVAEAIIAAVTAPVIAPVVELPVVIAPVVELPAAAAAPSPEQTPGAAAAPVLTLDAPQPERPGLSLPTQQELGLVTPPVTPLVTQPEAQLAPPDAALVPQPVVAGPVETLSAYEQLEKAGTAEHRATIHLTQPVGEGSDRTRDMQERLIAAGANVSWEKPGISTAEDGKTETRVLSLVYTHDERGLPAIHRELAAIAEVPAGSTYGVRVEDENAAGRTAVVESRMRNTPEAATALAATLHDGDPQTARLLIQRPVLEDVWALEAAGAKVARVYLVDGPGALVSYPATEAAIAAPVSIELDRIERDSNLSRPVHNSNDRDRSGPLLGEDPTQQQQRQELARAEGLVLEAHPRYEMNELAERNTRAKAYFQEEIIRPTDPLGGQLANGEPFKGGVPELLRLEQPDRDALEASWKAGTTTLVLVVKEAPDLDLAEKGIALWPARVAEALREAGAETTFKNLGVSPDTGLERHDVTVTFPNNSPDLARIQATLNRLADQDGVVVPTAGYYEREALLGRVGSTKTEPVLAERDRPWLQAVVAISEPTMQERRELSRGGAVVEDAKFNGADNKPVLLVSYDLDNPLIVGRISPTLERADEAYRLRGESDESREARRGRTEQYQADIHQGREQTPVVGESGVALGFADRIRVAVQDRLESLRWAMEAASPENIAIYEAKQSGLADRKGMEQQAAEKAAYDKAFNGPTPVPAPVEAAAPAPGSGEERPKTSQPEAEGAKDPRKEVIPTAELTQAAPNGGVAVLSGGIAPGTAGTSAELSSEKVLRERRDDERTVPVVMDGPKEGKVLETTEQLKPATAGKPDQEKAAGEKTTPPGPVETPVVAAAVVSAAVVSVPEPVKAVEREFQFGIIGMEGTNRAAAGDRMEMVRAALLTAGAHAEAVVPPGRDQTMATLSYAYDPLDKRLPAINKVLHDVQSSQPSMIKEEPHSMHFAGIKANAHEIERPDWPKREGQFATAHIVIDDADQRGAARADNIKGELGKAGAVVGEAKKDGHGHVEMDVSYHTHTPNIAGVNRTLERAGDSAGIEVRESSTDRSARYEGARDLEQKKSPEKERERGE